MQRKRVWRIKALHLEKHGDSAEKAYIQLLLDSDDRGRALFNQEFLLIAHNAQFEQFCGKFLEKISIENLGVPEILLEKMRNGNGCGITPEAKKHSIIASDSTEYIVFVKSVLYHSKKFFSVTLYSRILREIELYLRLKVLYGVTEKEFRIISFVKKGWTNEEIAEELKISVASIKMHLTRIYNEKFKVSNRAELVGVLEDIVEP